MRLRRKLGKKVLKLGGNAIIAYRQEVTYEGEKTHKVNVRYYKILSNTAEDMEQQHFYQIVVMRTSNVILPNNR